MYSFPLMHCAVCTLHKHIILLFDFMSFRIIVIIMWYQTIFAIRSFALKDSNNNNKTNNLVQRTDMRVNERWIKQSYYYYYNKQFLFNYYWTLDSRMISLTRSLSFLQLVCEGEQKKAKKKNHWLWLYL